MSVLIFADQADGHFKKTSFEALAYGAKVAEQLGTTAEAIVLGTVNDDRLRWVNMVLTKVHHVANEALNHVDAQVLYKSNC